MKLSDAVKQYEECMSQDAGCLVQNCPLHLTVSIASGEPYDETGQHIWKISGCSVMGAFERWLKYRKPGKRYPEEAKAS